MRALLDFALCVLAMAALTALTVVGFLLVVSVASYVDNLCRRVRRVHRPDEIERDTEKLRRSHVKDGSHLSAHPGKAKRLRSL